MLETRAATLLQLAQLKLHSIEQPQEQHHLYRSVASTGRWRENGPITEPWPDRGNERPFSTELLARVLDQTIRQLEKCPQNASVLLEILGCSWLTQAVAAIHFFEAAGSLTSSLYLNSSEGAQRSSRMVRFGVSFQVVTRLVTRGAV